MMTPKDVMKHYKNLLGVAAFLLMVGLDLWFPADIAFKMYFLTPPGSEHLLTGWATFNAAPLISLALILTNAPIVAFFFVQAVRLARGIAAISNQNKTSTDDTIKKLLQHMTKWLILSGVMIMVSSINWFWKATNLFDSGMENKAFFGFYYKGDLSIPAYLCFECLMVYGRLFTGLCQVMSVAPRDQKGGRQGFFTKGRSTMGTTRKSSQSVNSSVASGSSMNSDLVTSVGSMGSVSSPEQEPQRKPSFLGGKGNKAKVVPTNGDEIVSVGSASSDEDGSTVHASASDESHET